MDINDPKVKKLKERVLSNQAEREAYNKRHEALQDQIRQILDAKDNFRCAFWCTECEADFSGKGQKIVRQHSGRLPIAWWVGRCPAGHKCIRRITDRTNDRYVIYSRQLRIDRMRHRYDLLSPNDPMFWVMYGHKHGFEQYKSLNNDDKPPHDDTFA